MGMAKGDSYDGAKVRPYLKEDRGAAPGGWLHVDFHLDVGTF